MEITTAENTTTKTRTVAEKVTQERAIKVEQARRAWKAYAEKKGRMFDKEKVNELIKKGVRPPEEARLQTEKMHQERNDIKHARERAKERIIRDAWENWKKTLPPQEQKNRATDETIEIAVRRGISPQQVENAGLSDDARLKKAEELLGKKLSEEQKTAILEAHYYGVATNLDTKEQYVALEGKEKGTEAGVGNYEKKDLAAKAAILKGEGRKDRVEEADMFKDDEKKDDLEEEKKKKERKAIFDPKERRILMENAIVGKELDATGVTDPALQFFIDQYNDVISRGNLKSELKDQRGNLVTIAPGVDKVIGSRNIEDFMEDVRRLKDEPGATAARVAEAATILTELENQIKDEREIEQLTGRVDNGFWNLSKDDQRELQQGGTEEVEAWLNKHFNILYASADDSNVDPQQDQYMHTLQQAYGDAKRFLKDSPEKIKILTANYEARTRGIALSFSIGGGDTEKMKGAAAYVGANSLNMAHVIDGGKANRMAHLAEEKLEDFRMATLNKGGEPWLRGHVTPKIMDDMKKALMEQTVLEAKLGVGEYADFYQVKVPLLVAEAEKGKGIYGKRYEAEKAEHYTGKKSTDKDYMDLVKLREFMEDKILADEIRRAVILGLNIFKNTQREGEIASRGHDLFGLDSYFSSSGAGFKGFNPETFFMEKWDIPNKEEHKIHDRIKAGMVRDWIHHKEEHDKKKIHLTDREKKILGDELFKKFFSIADYASSGWRAKGTLQAQQDYFERRIKLERNDIAPGVPDLGNLTAAERAEVKKRQLNFGLFIRVQRNFSGEEAEDFGSKKDAWEKIIQYRTDSIIHMLRIGWPELDRNIPKIQHMNGEVFTAGNAVGVNDFDSFRKVFGSAMRTAREAGFAKADPVQLDFSRMNTLPDDIRENLQKHLSATVKDRNGQPVGGAAALQTLQTIFHDMQHYVMHEIITSEYDNNGNVKLAAGHGGHAARNVIEDDFEFMNMNNRAWVVDDMMFDKIQNPTFNMKDPREKAAFESFTPVSKRWSSDPSNDGLVRDFNDIDDADKAVAAYLDFLKAPELKDKLEAAKRCAEKEGSIDGQLKRAETMKVTFMEYVRGDTIPLFFDAIGVHKLPFEWAMTENQQILGPHALPQTQAQRLHLFHQLRQFMVGSVHTQIEGEQASAAKKKAEGRQKIKARAGLSASRQQELIQAYEEHIDKELKHKLHEIDHEADKWEHAAKIALGVTKKDRIKLSGLALLFALLALAFAEAAEQIKDTPEFAGMGTGGSGHGGSGH